ncbi:PepSY-associated TM helix domain-containing protein [Pareuzebyella sediminis]|uniref:PepSY-associated TM helix domain-containing protein n=1 Tax=Pareuzebyella sediminis TaxID=2607998 RepID=UPI0018E12654|nr:PepSY-associated TM helix domain-containing protein [Pareuzebyella sediminis]
MKRKTYTWVKNVHLYAALTTVVFLSMYLLSGLMMMGGAYGEEIKTSVEIPITASVVENDREWAQFIEDQGIEGRLIWERTFDSGKIIREYNTLGTMHKLEIAPDKRTVDLEIARKDMSGYINDLHRLKGYKGPMLYWVYALLVDVTALSLMVFVATGIPLWLQVVDNQKIGWAILIIGLIYVCIIVFNLM